MKVFFIAQTPPPVHGASLMNQLVYDVLADDDQFDITEVNPSVSRSISDMQKPLVLRVILSIGIFCRVLFCRVIRYSDITYINAAPSGLSGLRDLLFVFVSCIRSKRVLVHFHGCLNSSSFYFGRMETWFIPNKVEYIFLDTSLIPSHLMSGRKVFVLPNCLPFEKEYMPHLVEAKPRLTVGFLANMLPSKGVKDFLDICADVLRSGYTFDVLLAGGWTKKYCEDDFNEWKAKHADICEYFEHLGSVGIEEKVSFFSRLDIFLYPTRNDAFPLVVLESMVNGVAVISSEIGAIKSILGAGGLICCPNSKDEFKTNLKNLLGDHEALELEKARLIERYHKEFSRKQFVENVLAVFGV